MRDSFPKCSGVNDRMDGKGREITIGRTNEMSGKILQVMEVNVYSYEYLLETSCWTLNAQYSVNVENNIKTDKLLCLSLGLT
jgi:hypothetical protein